MAVPGREPAIVWFRDDLRISDQPALTAAVQSGRPVLALYLYDGGASEGRPLGGAQRWWLHHSLAALSSSLAAIGGRLDIVACAHEELPRLAASVKAPAVYWTRRYGAQAIACDAHLKSALGQQGVEAASFNGRLLREPWEVRTKTGDPFRVFTPFWRAHLAPGDPAAPLPAPGAVVPAEWPAEAPARTSLDALALLPTTPDWAGGLRAAWTPGEAGARERLAAFFDEGLALYANERDRPDRESTSRLSPHLRFGEISARQIFHATRHMEAERPELSRQTSKFLAELGWREFSYHLLFHNPDLATRNFQRRFDAFPWPQVSAKIVQAWRKGRTGYPIVDAGMRELWSTGFMHNRVRMVVASFLVKHLQVDWRVGEEWFWDTLCDADPASNAASWQWVAGCGADAAPYFRIFNPILQGEKFDPEGDYVRRHVPELANVPAAYIHKPWTAPAPVLARAGVRLGVTYPAPIVDHGAARESALAAFAELKDQTPA
ncbi:MAG: phrA [Hyphomicrobiales bacterium]|nr:phrA [Hyphomicrobiales bacterium]